jgi:hypothetical protein
VAFEFEVNQQTKTLNVTGRVRAKSIRLHDRPDKTKVKYGDTLLISPSFPGSAWERHPEGSAFQLHKALNINQALLA